MNQPPYSRDAGPGFAFSLKLPWFGLNFGSQRVALGEGGPSTGDTTGSVRPYPYMTGFKNFIIGMPYGSASTLLANPNGPNLGTGAVAFIPIGYTKDQTYAYRTY